MKQFDLHKDAFQVLIHSRENYDTLMQAASLAGLVRRPGNAKYVLGHFYRFGIINEYGGELDAIGLGGSNADPYGKGVDTKTVSKAIAFLKQFNNINPMSSLKEKFALAFKKEPQKSFFKAGITDKEDSLTEDGKAIFIEYLFKKNEVEFKKDVVDPILEEEKDNKKD